MFFYKDSGEALAQIRNPETWSKPRDVVETSCLETFQVSLDMTLSKLI